MAGRLLSACRFKLLRYDYDCTSKQLAEVNLRHDMLLTFCPGKWDGKAR
jgi:hypothetical protein